MEQGVPVGHIVPVLVLVILARCLAPIMDKEEAEFFILRIQQE